MENVTIEGEKQVLVLSEKAEFLLLVTTRWAKFLAIMSFVFTGLLVLGILTLVAIGARLTQNMPMPFPAAVIALVYLPIAGIYGVIGYFLLSFGAKCQSALVDRQMDDMEKGFLNLKNLFVMIGIMCIVSIATILLIGLTVGLIALSA